MTYLEQLCALAREKGIDPQEIINQFNQASNATGYHREELARIALNLLLDYSVATMASLPDKERL